jgi:hypothetical protein
MVGKPWQVIAAVEGVALWSVRDDNGAVSARSERAEQVEAWLIGASNVIDPAIDAAASDHLGAAGSLLQAGNYAGALSAIETVTALGVSSFSGEALRLRPTAEAGATAAAAAARATQEAAAVAAKATQEAARIAQATMAASARQPTTASSTQGAANRPTAVPASTFTLGSTKQEVAAVQGTPQQASEYTWRYGCASVSFSATNMKVVGWSNCNNILKVR